MFSYLCCYVFFVAVAVPFVVSKIISMLSPLFRAAWEDPSLEYAMEGIKVFYKKGYNAKPHVWKYPFVDVYFYTHDEIVLNTTDFLPALKSDVFPLVLRPFEGRLYPGPRDPRAFLTRFPYFSRKTNIFGETQRVFTADINCFSGIANHRKEVIKSGSEIFYDKCSKLTKYFPFVKMIRGPGSAFCQEELVFRGATLNTFTRSAENIPVC